MAPAWEDLQAALVAVALSDAVDEEGRDVPGPGPARARDCDVEENAQYQDHNPAAALG
jgi:hypothetical protein